VAVYSVNRRRAILLLVLTSVMLLTIDLRGNAVVDAMRSGFSKVLAPFERAAEVIATPIRNMWHGATDYQDLERENKQLKDQIASQRGADIAANLAIFTAQQLSALNRIDGLSSYDKVTTRVVGNAPGNFRQVIEIDHGADRGLLIGMPVVNFAGLVGKITKVYPDRSLVMLFTDLDYAIECKISTRVDLAAITAPSVPVTPSGISVSDINTTTSTTSPSTTTTVPFSFDPPAETTTPPSTSIVPASVTSTTVELPIEEIERGTCEGRGADRLPIVAFVTDNPAFGSLGVGDIVSTAGGSTSLSPADIVIGEVINVQSRSGSAGPLIEIQLAPNLDQLNVLQVILYRPLAEVAGG
jgi:rod shape-determining protein MreC